MEYSLPPDGRVPSLMRASSTVRQSSVGSVLKSQPLRRPDGVQLCSGQEAGARCQHIQLIEDEIWDIPPINDAAQALPPSEVLNSAVTVDAGPVGTLT